MTSSEERTSAEVEDYRIERALMDCVAPPSKGGRRNPSVPSRCGIYTIISLHHTHFVFGKLVTNLKSIRLSFFCPHIFAVIRPFWGGGRRGLFAQAAVPREH